VNTVLTTFLYAFRRSRWMLAGWAIPIFLIGAITAPFYDLVAENEKQLLLILQTLPPQLTAFIGGEEAARFLTPFGFLELRYFAFLPVTLGIYGAVVGSGMLSADEERGVLDFVLAHPASRASVFWGRFAALALGVLILLVSAWLGLWVGVLRVGQLEFGFFELALPFVSALVYTLGCSALALALSMTVPSRVAAAMLTGIYVFAGYIITNLARAIPGLEAWALFSPVTYFQSDAMAGIDPWKLSALLVPGIALAVLALAGFKARDIRVAGDGGWKLPFIGKR